MHVVAPHQCCGCVAVMLTLENGCEAVTMATVDWVYKFYELVYLVLYALVSTSHTPEDMC